MNREARPEVDLGDEAREIGRDRLERVRAQAIEPGIARGIDRRKLSRPLANPTHP